MKLQSLIMTFYVNNKIYNNQVHEIISNLLSDINSLKHKQMNIDYCTLIGTLLLGRWYLYQDIAVK